MKNTILICSLLFMASVPVFAGEKKLIKSCSTVLTMPEATQKIETQIDIFEDESALTSTITQKLEGNTNTYGDRAQIDVFNVQDELSADIEQDIDNLNLAERLIVHALALTEDPIFNDTLSAGLDLRKIRSAKIYTIGKPTNMGVTAIIEAKDEAGNNLGSFLGGFLVSPCK